jgi:pilus assembly protein Flp/PilA
MSVFDLVQIRGSEMATAIEYGLIAALVAVAAIGTMSSLGAHMKGVPSDKGHTYTLVQHGFASEDACYKASNGNGYCSPD